MVIDFQPTETDEVLDADNMPGAIAAAIPDIINLLLFINQNPIFINVQPYLHHPSEMYQANSHPERMYGFT